MAEGNFPSVLKSISEDNSLVSLLQELKQIAQDINDSFVSEALLKLHSKIFSSFQQKDEAILDLLRRSKNLDSQSFDLQRELPKYLCISLESDKAGLYSQLDSNSNITKTAELYDTKCLHQSSGKKQAQSLATLEAAQDKLFISRSAHPLAVASQPHGEGQRGGEQTLAPERVRAALGRSVRLMQRMSREAVQHEAELEALRRDLHRLRLAVRGEPEPRREAQGGGGSPRIASSTASSVQA